MTDKIYIRDLMSTCIIGTKPEEREKKQEVVINIVLECDLASACKSDKLDDTLNYRILKDAIMAFVEKSEFFLIERLADGIAGICLDCEEVSSATVTVDKPGALTGARSVAVEIERSRCGGPGI